MIGELALRGKIIGFEEHERYVLRKLDANDSPFRLLQSLDDGFSFLVVNPFDLTENYTFDIEDDVIVELGLTPGRLESLAVLCIVRHHEENLLVNLRSPLIFNTERGLFRQIILDNEAYPVSSIIPKKGEQ